MNGKNSIKGKLYEILSKEKIYNIERLIHNIEKIKDDIIWDVK